MHVKAALNFSLCFCVFYCFNVSAQPGVQGVAIDANARPIANANVLLLRNNDSSLVKGMVTQPMGTFAFSNLVAGKYLLVFTHTGFNQLYTATFDISNAGTVANLGNIQLTALASSLSAVTVSAKRPMFEQKIDRMVVNVSSSITSAGSNALEILERSPGIVVDQQNNTLSMNGKTGLLLMINGKINRMPVSAVLQMLASMNAGNIETIELIHTPPSSLDAEGNAGYINIVLKANTQFGTNGSYTVTAGYSKGLLSEGSLNFNNRKNKVNFFGDVSLTRNHSPQFYTFYHRVTNKGDVIETTSDVDRNTVRLFYTGKLGLDYEIGKRTILGILISGYDTRLSIISNNQSNIRVNGRVDTLLRILNNDVNDWKNLSGNLNLQHTLSEQEKLTININYDYYKADNPDTYVNDYYDPGGSFLFDQKVASHKKTPITIWVSALDYSKKLSRQLDWEAGLKNTISQFNNNVRIDRLQQISWIIDESLSGQYQLKETVMAAYSSLRYAAGKKLNMKLGLRYEYTSTNLGSATQKNIVDRKYGQFFPSFFISYAPTELQSFNGSYSHRITRPTFNDMAPFLIFYDPYTLVAGNPALQPSISDALSASYTINRKIITLNYSYDGHPITNFSPKVDSATNKETLSAANQKNRKTASLSFSIPVKISSYWNMQNNIIGIWQQMNAFLVGKDIRIEQEYISFSSTQTLRLGNEFSFELSGIILSGGVSGVYRNKPYGFLNAGVQKKLVKQRSTIRFNALNILNSMVRNNIANYPEHNLVVTGRLRIAYPSFRLTFTHNFGKENVKTTRARSTGAEEEKGRISTQ